jgi:hypothetical protein
MAEIPRMYGNVDMVGWVNTNNANFIGEMTVVDPHGKTGADPQ